jgi:hypothetical protein
MGLGLGMASATIDTVLLMWMRLLQAREQGLIRLLLPLLLLVMVSHRKAYFFPFEIIIDWTTK